jgi:hypothetical protein
MPGPPFGRADWDLVPEQAEDGLIFGLVIERTAGTVQIDIIDVRGGEMGAVKSLL